MSNPGGGLWRIARGGLLAVCCTALAVLGHLGGGGQTPAPAQVCATVLLGAVFAVLGDRRRDFAQIAGAALVSQAVFHLAFSLSSHGAVADLGHSPAAGSAAIGNANGLAAEMWPSLSMVVGHVVAALAMAAVVAYGEVLVWALFHLFGLVGLPKLRQPSPAGPLRVPCARAAEVVRPGGCLVARVHPRRGPPAASWI